jgi:S-adenosylmethionine:tRNA ribosyltransferase-isomerase
LTAGETITLEDSDGHGICQLMLLAKMEDGVWAARPDSRESYVDILDRVGRVPLPPYIRDGEMIDADRENYQTVFAEEPGAVAAPTAGLHFTDILLDNLHDRGIGVCRVTLHVGLGTFRPIATETLAAHDMHSEWANIGADTVTALRRCRDEGGRIVAVGTTAVRTLETAASGGQLQPWKGETSLFIRPPYQFRSVDALMTNFHLPKSTLLVLVRTFGGDSLIRTAYEEAVREKYRFYSYGDAMLIL